MELRIRRTTEPPGLALAGEVDLSNVGQFEAAVEPLVADGGEVTLDLEQVGFMDSAGIQVVLSAGRSLAGRGRLILARPRPLVGNVLRLIRVDAIPGIQVVGDDAAAEGAPPPPRS